MTTLENAAPEQETVPDVDTVNDEPAEENNEPDHHDDAEDDDRDDIGRARYQAKKYRARLRETEAERDQLRDELAAQRRAIVDWRATTAADGAVAPELLDANAISIDDLLDEHGRLDMGAVDKFIDDTAIKFRVQRAVKPNPQQGNPSQAPAAPRLADAFNPKHR